jgi:hypothetical protein
MQPRVEDVRSSFTAAQIEYLIQDAPAVDLAAGLELVDLGLNVIADISDDLAGGKVERSSYATMHGTATFAITRTLDWGSALVRPYLTINDGSFITPARFNLGVYHTSTPAHALDESPPTYQVEGYDLLLRLNQPVGDAYSIAAGDAYLDRVEEIFLSRGYLRYLIDPEKAATVAPTSRVWAFDPQTTWLSIVNDLLASIGYAGVWSDWNGYLRAEAYQLPLNRSIEWIHSDDQASTMLSTKRSIERDFTFAPNRWVVYRSNNIDGATPVEGDGIYTWTNENVGDTSVTARGGLTITRPPEGVDVADQASLELRAQQIIAADMEIPVTIPVETSPNPLHWHFDRLYLADSSAGLLADVLCTQWSLPLPPTTGDMVVQLKVLSQ